MGRRTTYTPGTPNWIDLTTPDVAAAQAFYAAVFGWTVREGIGDSYAFFERDGAVVAGLAPLTEDQRERGVPPAWSMYVCTDDADATAARATELGGSVAVAPFTVEGAGRLGVVADPQGAVVLLWEPGMFLGAELVNEVGAWSWNDLQTPDPAAAAPFYEALFGWETAEVPGSGGAYRGIAHAGRTIAGIMRVARPVTQPYWTVYVGVDDIEGALERVAVAGGQPLGAPIAVPAGRFAVVLDPQGAMVCLVEGAFDD